MLEEFKLWLMYCWSQQNPNWLEHMGPSSFDEYLIDITPLSWDLYA